ncbi:hypothetical protein [Sphingomonas bacterium]|uniref:hypothetical protein n=1 Tax=Sphingomonas bacterium TaxID=1895847 RepID=UPI001576DF63|nr:hypothetical protein [Sphingomonas bacterium]
MSRALNLNAPQEHVLETCAKHSAVITQIEVLRSGGTRVVLQDMEGAGLVTRAYKGKVISGPVRRAPNGTMRD